MKLKEDGVLHAAENSNRLFRGTTFFGLPVFVLLAILITFCDPLSVVACPLWQPNFRCVH